MKIQVTERSQAERAAVNALLVPEGVAIKLDSEAGKIAAALARKKEWTGKFRDTLLLYGNGGNERLLLVGLGKDGELDAERVRRAAAVALNRTKGLKVASLGIQLMSGRLKSEEAGAALAEGLTMAAYHFDARKKKPDDEPFKTLTIRLSATKGDAAFSSGVERGRAVGEAANLARRLGDRPGNEMTPTMLAAEARKVATREGLRCKIYRKAELEKRGMGGILGVSKGSSEPPVLIEMEYKPRRFKKTVCLVGKGLTFDTGGISIKPSAKMEEMKYDMCGGAAVIGAMMAIARLKPAVRVIGIVPSSENMPDAMAQKPGDTLVTASGLTVEVINTDAEGRLILADGLHHATGFDPDHIIDLATLTGACVVALGHDACGIFSNDDKLSASLKAAGEAAGDRGWPMPIFAEYQDELKSMVADMRNLGSREAGAGTAASFLSRFVGDHKSWAHLDIAGSAWGGRSRDYIGKAATGSGTRLLARFIESL